MNTSFQKSALNYSDEWYTPPNIFSKLGHFDLDPCSPMSPLWKIADHTFNAEEDGLSKVWFGRVWLNPPYSRPLQELFVRRMAEHGNGIMLLFNRCDNKLFHDVIFRCASGILFIKGRLKFYTPDGTPGGTAGCGSVLISFGQENDEILRHSGIPGRFFQIQQK